jgi:hypothetical protein
MEMQQKAYETIRAHLIQQGRPAKDLQTGSCFYRAEGGLKCAVGCLISDEAYNEKLEDHTPSDERVQEALRKSGWDFTEGGFSMLKAMQERHDTWKAYDEDGLQYVIERIDMVADDYGLEVVK